MNKAIVYALKDDEFMSIIQDSYNINEAGRKMGFAHEPGKTSKEKIRARMKELNISFKKKEKDVIQIEEKISQYNAYEIGFIGEKAFEFLCAKNKLEFFRESTDNKPFDYLINLNNEYKKVQIKTAEFSQNGKIEFYLNKTRIKSDGDKLKYSHQKYSIDILDYFFLYCIETNQGFLVNIKEVNNKSMLTIRLNESLNKQEKKCNFAEKYSFENVLKNISSLS